MTDAGASLTTDIHCHLVPEVDEGSRSLAESVLMARALEALGVTTVHATPHQFRFGNDMANERVRELARQVADHLRAAEVSLEVVPGAEYILGERLLDALERGEELVTWTHVGEAGAATCVLVELPLRDPVVNVARMASLFLRRGIQPVMAHPERLQALVDDPPRASLWRDAGWAFQLDLLSLVGSYGKDAQRLSQGYLARGLYQFTGSDLHRTSQLDALKRAHDEFRRLTRAAENAR